MATHLVHIQSDLTTLPDDRRCALQRTPLPQDPQDSLLLVLLVLVELAFDPLVTLGGDPTERFGGFVANHVVLGGVSHDVEQGGDRVRGGELTEDVGDLVAAVRNGVKSAR
jgi:hypothetical protein